MIDTVFKVVGKDRTKVHERLTEIVYGIEKQGRFNYQINVQEMEDGDWQGTVEIFWHKDSYPSHYGTKIVPQLPMGDKSVAVNNVYKNYGIKRLIESREMKK